MNRRSFLQAAFAAPLPLAAQKAEALAPNNIRITAVDVIVTNPAQSPMGNYVLVKITTNQAGLVGWGDATCTRTSSRRAKRRTGGND